MKCVSCYLHVCIQVLGVSQHVHDHRKYVKAVCVNFHPFQYPARDKEALETALITKNSSTLMYDIASMMLQFLSCV